MSLNLATNRPVLFLKAQKFAHQAGYYLLNGRWHKVKTAKPVPKGVPVAAHPMAAGNHAPVKHLSDDEWAQLKLPDSNVNAPTFNKQVDKLKQMAEAGDITGILASGYGVNTYGKKLAAIANHLLGLYGSEHKVSAGQKPGWHAAVQDVPAVHAPAIEPEPAQAPVPKPAAVAPTQPAPPPKPASPNPWTDDVWAQHYLPASNSNAPSHNKKIAAMKAAANKGDVAAIKYMNFGSNTYGKKQAKVAQALLAAMGGAAGPSGGGSAPTGGGGVAAAAPMVARVSVSKPAAPDHPLAVGPTLSMAAGESLINQPKPAAQPAPPAAPKVVSVAQTQPAAPVTAKALLFHNTQPGHNKFWSVSVNGNVLKTVYGKIGSKGQSTEKEFTSFSAATVAMAKLVQEKAGKGYHNAGTIDHVHTMAASATGAAAQQGGPKDGDTKTENGVQYVLKDGRWHKASPDPVAAAKDPKPAIPPVVAVAVPDFDSSKWGQNFKKVAEDLKASALANGKAGLKGKIISHKTGYKAGNFTITTAGFKLKNVGPNQTSAVTGHLRAQMHAFVTELLGSLDKKVQPKAPKVAKVTAAPAAPAPSAPAAPKVAANPAAPEPIDGWTKTGGQEGYNDGAFYTDPSGQKWYCKFSAGGEDVAKSETLALKLYEAAGQPVPEMKLVTRGGKVGTASKVIDGLKLDKAALQAGTAHAIFSGFAADAWLANWDTVGNNPAAGKGWDNIQFGPDGKAYRIDAGGALGFKGTGQKKSKAEWGDHVVELKTLLDPSINANTAKAFGQMTPADISASVAKVLAVSDQTITDLVAAYGPGSATDKATLTAKLIARKNSMAAQHPQAAAKTGGPKAPKKGKVDLSDTSWVKLKPGEKVVDSGEKFGVHFVKIEVPAKGFHADGIPKPYVYDKSSSQYVNAANTADIQAIYDLAVSSKDPAAVKNIKFDGIVKATGEKTGQKLSIDEHPSKAWVKEYATQVAAELEAQVHPTYRTEHRGSFAESYSSAAASIAARVKTIDHAKFKAWKDKAADYLVLNKDAGSGVPVPDPGQFKNVEPTSPEMVAFKSASDANFAKLSSAEQKACKSYTGSAYWNWNEALRSGDTTSPHFAAAQPMVKAFEKAAVELPDGIILHRGINVGGETYDSVVGAVIQDGSFQSSSYGSKAAFSGLQSQLRLHITKGVRGIMATSFSNYGTGEREIILHPNCRFVVMKVKKGHPNHVDVLVLPHEG